MNVLSPNNPFPINTPWPSATIIVCVYNGQDTIGPCLNSLKHIDYPDFEVIIVDDGSTDATREIVKQTASGPEFQLIALETNQGLSFARNVGMRAARGEIVAYLDSDAFATPQWLKHLAFHLLSTNHVGVGGPNLNPDGRGHISNCVDKSPGAPVPVLLETGEADHLPGCNLALRKSFLEAIGGFDPLFRVAGDDVDLCWRVQRCGGTLGYSPQAVVWHCRRNSIQGYLRQQRHYGRAEALLWRKWPSKFNPLGHISFPGCVYAGGLKASESVYSPSVSFLKILPQIPEWNLVILATLFAAAVGVGFFHSWGAVILLAIELGLSLRYAIRKAWTAPFETTGWFRFYLRILTTFFHLAQPVVRLRGRLEYGLTPWRSLRKTRSETPALAVS